MVQHCRRSVLEVEVERHEIGPRGSVAKSYTNRNAVAPLFLQSVTETDPTFRVSRGPLGALGDRVLLRRHVVGSMYPSTVLAILACPYKLVIFDAVNLVHAITYVLGTTGLARGISLTDTIAITSAVKVTVLTTTKWVCGNPTGTCEGVVRHKSGGITIRVL